jgi:hypothetical protein
MVDVGVRLRPSAADKIFLMPAVGSARPLIVNEKDEAYLKPMDGSDASSPDWRRWVVDRSRTSQSRAHWALEAISAPLAWGCSVGSRDVRITVIDYSLTPISELTQNTVFHSYIPDSLIDPKRHGNAVASALAAYGNNGRGITGVMFLMGARVPWGQRCSDRVQSLHSMIVSSM